MGWCIECDAAAESVTVTATAALAVDGAEVVGGGGGAFGWCIVW